MKKVISSLLASTFMLTYLTLPVVAQTQASTLDTAQVQETKTLSTSPETWFTLDGSGGITTASYYLDENSELTIPSSVGGVGVGYIQTRGFYGLEAVETISIPSSVSSIGDEAFAQCTSLQFLMIPRSVAHIGDNILRGTDNVTVMVYSGSEAEAYCVKNYIPFRVLDEASTTPDADSTPEVSTPDVSTPSTNEDLVIPENGKLAQPSSAKMQINGKNVSFDAYNIEGFNYFRLTDLAYALTGSTSQFNIVWDNDKQAINIVTGTPYTVRGEEFLPHTGKNEAALPFYSDTYVDGSIARITVYIIDDKSYFQLNDLQFYLDYTLGWDANTSTISLKTPEKQGDLVQAYVDLIARQYLPTSGDLYFVIDLDKVTNLSQGEKDKVAEYLEQDLGETGIRVVLSNEDKLRDEGLLESEFGFGVPIQFFPFGSFYTVENITDTATGFNFKLGKFHSQLYTEYFNGTATLNGNIYDIKY